MKHPNVLSMGTFADDTVFWNKPHQKDHGLDTAHALQEELENFTSWCNRWKLVLNEDKCETLTIKGKMRKGMDEPTLYILGKKVKQVESMRYLGLFLDPKLNYEVHMKKVEGRLAGRLSSLYSINANYSISPTTLLKIYKTQIRPIWEYGCMFYIQD